VFGSAKMKKTSSTDALFHKDRGRRPPPVRGTLPLNPIQKTPPTPSLFRGGSLAGWRQTNGVV